MAQKSLETSGVVLDDDGLQDIESIMKEKIQEVMDGCSDSSLLRVFLEVANSGITSEGSPSDTLASIGNSAVSLSQVQIFKCCEVTILDRDYI